MQTLNVTILPDEFWYGFCVNCGVDFPLNSGSNFQMDIDPNMTNNQASPLLVSSKGRFIWCNDGFALTVKDGEINAACQNSMPVMSDGHHNLRSAYLAAAFAYFPPKKTAPPNLFFTAPQYNTWIELIYNQNQKDILQYAHSLLKEGYPPGILMIDDGWQQDFGNWRFKPDQFPAPKQMIDELHSLGFTVMLWSCPFVSPDSLIFRNLAKQDVFVKDANGEIAIRKWWNGHSAVLDLSNPDAVSWYKAENRFLMDEYGIDGFKFDAGDGEFYRNDDITYGNVDANTQTMLWLEFGLNYPYNEYRAGFKMAGEPLVHRLADKNHSWNENGLSALIPNQLTQGILGYAFTCPDMIGGGEYENFTQNSANLDEELFVRYAQCAALMPMMQFSAAPWRVLKPEYAKLCQKAAEIHMSFSDIILQLVQENLKNGEPVTRYMEYQFPDEGMEKIADQFMLGENILVAPVLQKGAAARTVYLPKGKWKYADGTVYDGGQKVTVPAPLEVLPYFTLE